MHIIQNEIDLQEKAFCHKTKQKDTEKKELKISVIKANLLFLMLTLTLVFWDTLSVKLKSQER